jgi:fibronectin type 3 domain-containing protein
VKRSATPGKGYVAIAPFQTSTSFTDATAEPGKTWHYVVTALNTGGESVPSNEAAVTLPAK